MAWRLQAVKHGGPACSGARPAKNQSLTLKKGKTMKKTASVIGALLFAIGLSACNTMAGMGEDIQGGGKKLEGAAERQHQDIKRN